MLGLGYKMVQASTGVAVTIERISMTLRRRGTDLESPTAPSSCDSSTIANIREQEFYLIKGVADFFTTPFISSYPLHSLIITRVEPCFLVKYIGILILKERTLPGSNSLKSFTYKNFTSIREYKPS